MSPSNAFNVDPRFSIQGANSNWTHKADISSASAATTTLEFGEWYKILNLAANTVYLGWGVDATEANDQSDTDKGHPLAAGDYIQVCVNSLTKLVLSATPASGTSSVRVLELLGS